MKFLLPRVALVLGSLPLSWDPVLPRGEVVMSHFSARYSDEELRRIVSERLPDQLRGVVKLFGIGATTA
jgi:hypothetical protein